MTPAGKASADPRPDLAIVAIVGAVLAIGAIDYVAGPLVRLGVVYPIPVLVTAIWANRRSALVAAAVASLTWVAVDVALGPHPTLAIDVTNVGLRFVLLGLMATVLAMLQAALRASQASDQRSRELLAFAAQHLREPTASVGRAAELLLAEEATLRQQGFLIPMVADLRAMGRVVRSLLQFVRAERDDRSPVMFNVAQFCQSNAWRWQAEPSFLQPSIDLDIRDPTVTVLGDPEAFGEALSNLVDNARRHAHSHVQIQIRRCDQVVEIAVLDDGAGLPPTAADRAFEPFVALDGEGGGGLGLAVARALLEADKGHLTYTGGAFVITLPAH